jgi:hypothetical protein
VSGIIDAAFGVQPGGGAQKVVPGKPVVTRGLTTVLAGIPGPMIAAPA